MTQRLLDYNPLTGMTVTFDYHEHDDSFSIIHTQDSTAVVEANKVRLQDLDQHKKESKAGWAKYATLTEGMILDMKARHGVDFMDPNHWKKAMQLINSEYTDAKVTTYKHDR